MQKKYQRKEFLKLLALARMSFVSGPLRFISSGKKKENQFPGGSADVTYYKSGDPEYDSLRKGFNKRINKFPRVIALCKTEAGVAEAVAYASGAGLPIAIKSGGHCMEGFSCNDGGMVINVSLLNKIEWINNETIKVGPGCTISHLYDEILPKGKIIPGGSCGSVGIGGLTLGGGYGLLARKYGLTCDSLQEVSMVDAKGEIRNTANDKELLWACKGGGNGNFGVITSLTFKLHKAPATLQSFRFRTHNINAVRAKQILQNWFETTADLPPSCFSAFVLNKKTIYILLTNAEKHTAHVQNVIDKLSVVADKTTSTKPQPIASALKVFYGDKNPQFFKNASAGLYKSFSDIEPIVDSVIEIVMTSPGMIYQVNTLGGKITQPEFEKASAFPHRAYPYFSELQTYWQTEKQGARLIERFEAVQEIFINNGIKAQYRNYPDVKFKNWETMYYGDNYQRLRSVKFKYDRYNQIRHEQSVATLAL